MCNWILTLYITHCTIHWQTLLLSYTSQVSKCCLYEIKDSDETYLTIFTIHQLKAPVTKRNVSTTQHQQSLVSIQGIIIWKNEQTQNLHELQMSTRVYMKWSFVYCCSVAYVITRKNKVIKGYWIHMFTSNFLPVMAYIILQSWSDIKMQLTLILFLNIRGINHSQICFSSQLHEKRWPTVLFFLHLSSVKVIAYVYGKTGRIRL